VSLLWTGFPGQRLQLVATDAHARVQRAGWLELPPLPDGGWAAQLELGKGVTPRAVAAGAEWLGVGDAGVWLYRAGAGTRPIVSLPPHREGEEVVDLATAGDRFVVGTSERIDVIDLATPAVLETPMPSVRLLDLAASPVGALVLFSDAGDPTRTVLRVAELRVPSVGAPVLSAPSDLGVPNVGSPRIQRTAGRVHLFGLEKSGRGLIYTWPEGSLAADPTVAEMNGGWRGVGPWERGAVLLAEHAVRLLEYGGSGWSEVSRIELPADPTAATAVQGGRLIVLVPGEVLDYDITAPAAPVLASRHPGSAYRAVEPVANGEVLLWSPPLAAPPLRWNPATAVPGDGFHTVIDGLP
jgi:hypothetical protein